MDLSIIIPARNEIFLKRTIEDILEHREGNTEIIVGLDGYDDPTIQDMPIRIVRHETSVGQRAITNEAVRLSESRYVMKVDAHCSFDKGFDVKMMKLMQDNITMVPVMKNLHVFDWICPEGHTRYQGPSGPCTVCSKDMVRNVVWKAKNSPKSTAYRFDTDMHFQYWNDFGEKQSGDLTETLSLQGSCFMVTREKYLDLDLCSEQFHSWGQQGVEVACKTWLTGGRVMVNRTTWYAHMFRTQGGDFSFPYENPNSKVVENREISKRLFRDNTWPKATRSFQWLINKFNPPGWKVPTKGILYYTDNQLDEKILKLCQKYLLDVGIPVTSVSLQPLLFGRNIVVPLVRGMLTMAKQILVGLEVMDCDIVYMAEHDVLYHPSHFSFTPEKKDVYYYNTNSWMYRKEDGHCLYYEHRSLSGMCAWRETLLTHYRERVRRIEALLAEAGTADTVKATSGNDIPLREAIHRLGFEPGTHNRPERIDSLPCEDYRSEQPNIDIKHNHNWTKNRWHLTEFRDKSVGQTWKESDMLPYWISGKEIL